MQGHHAAVRPTVERGSTIHRGRKPLRLRVWLAVWAAPSPVSRRWITLRVRGRWAAVHGAVDALAGGGQLVTTAAPGARRRPDQPAQKRYMAGSIPVVRPKTRDDCRGAYRPCPWLTCRYNLPTGCVLDDVEGAGTWQDVRTTHGLRLRTRLSDDVASLAEVLSP